MKKDLYLGDLMMAAATLIWGGMTVFSKQILAELDIFNLIALRFLIGFIVCYVIFFKRYMNLDRRTVYHSFVLGTWLFVSYFFMVYGCSITSASNSGFMMSLSVVFIPVILGIRYRRMPSKRLMASIVVTIFGVALLCLGNNFSLNFGDVLCIICAFCYAFQMIYTEKYARQDDPVLLGTLQLFFVAVFGLIFSFILEDLTLPSTAMGWGQLLYLAVLCSSVAFVLQTSAEKRIPSSHASLIFSAMPVPVALFAYFLLDEPIGFRQYIGIAVVCLGVLIMEYKKSDRAEELENLQM